MSVVVKPRTCRQCGVVFDGGPRAWYCPECRQKRKQDANANFRKKGRKADRPIGSTDNCVRCGAEYIVNSARQKYCHACAYEAIRDADRPASRAWNQSHKQTYYPEKNAKRNKQRAENPELVRAKDRERYAKRKLKISESKTQEGEA